jgi:hypothetical protein
MKKPTFEITKTRTMLSCEDLLTVDGGAGTPTMQPRGANNLPRENTYVPRDQRAQNAAQELYKGVPHQVYAPRPGERATEVTGASPKDWSNVWTQYRPS